MIVTLKNNGFSAKIDSYGAQLISLQDPAGTEYIWQRDPKQLGQLLSAALPDRG